MMCLMPACIGWIGNHNTLGREAVNSTGMLRLIDALDLRDDPGATD